MKLELIRNKENRIVGYKLVKEVTDNTHDVEYVRDMIFSAMDEDVLTYDGRTTDKQSGETVELRWVKKWHASIKRQEMEKEVQEIVKNKKSSL